MAPVKSRGRASGAAVKNTSKDQWVEGEVFQFKKSPMKVASPASNQAIRKKNRRHSTLLRRLDIDMDRMPNSPKSPAMRRTRRMSMAHISAKAAAATTPAATSKIPRSASDKHLTKSSKVATTTKMTASTASRSKLPPSGKAAASRAKSTSTIASKKISSLPSTDESWIQKITSPKVFYQQSPVKLMGAQKRKSYSTATSSLLQVEMADIATKRPREVSPSPVPRKKTRRSAAALGSSTSEKSLKAPKKSTPSPSKKNNKEHRGAGAEKKNVSPQAKTSRSKSNLRTPSKAAKKTPQKLSKSAAKSKSVLRTPSPRKTSTRTPAKKAKTPAKNKSPAAKALEKSKSSKFSPSLATESPSPLLKSPSPTKIPRSLRRTSARRVTLTGSSPALGNLDFKRKTPRPAVGRRNLVLQPQDTGSSPPGRKLYLSSAAAAPSPLKRLVKASRANQFTPRPQAQPSKLLQQTMKNKLTCEIMLNKMPASMLLDSSVATVCTPAPRPSPLLSNAGVVAPSTPASSPNLPPTPTSAQAASRYASRSSRMVATARRNMSTYREENSSSTASMTTLHSSTPLHTSPLFSSYTNGTSSTNGGAASSRKMTPSPRRLLDQTASSCTGSNSSSAIADFTASVMESQEDSDDECGNGEVNESGVEPLVHEELTNRDVSHGDGPAGAKNSKKGYCSIM